MIAAQFGAVPLLSSDKFAMKPEFIKWATTKIRLPLSSPNHKVKRILKTESLPFVVIVAAPTSQDTSKTESSKNWCFILIFNKRATLYFQNRKIIVLGLQQLN